MYYKASGGNVIHAAGGTYYKYELTSLEGADMEIEKVYMSKANAQKLQGIQTELSSKRHELDTAREKLEEAAKGPKGDPRAWDLRVYKLEQEVKVLTRKASRLTVTAQVSPAIAQEITKEMENEK